MLPGSALGFLLLCVLLFYVAMGISPRPQTSGKLIYFETSIIFGWKWFLVGWAGSVIKQDLSQEADLKSTKLNVLVESREERNELPTKGNS